MGRAFARHCVISRKVKKGKKLNRCSHGAVSPCRWIARETPRPSEAGYSKLSNFRGRQRERRISFNFPGKPIRHVGEEQHPEGEGQPE
jgi:hypothetical protein